MILEHREAIHSNFDGTIIDIETIGKFNARYRDTDDIREYEYIRQVIFGYIDRHALTILYVRDTEEIDELNERVASLIGNLTKPFYAFNTVFERSVLYHGLGRELHFDGELQAEKYESKASAVSTLGIPNYDDPFFDRGILCMQAWESGDFDKAIAHNRACLLKERDILLLRGFREPEGLTYTS
ncbi:MAG TPA: hypothetical protein G4O18_06770 [Dehalococcoidia bacterium]|nr:hypothetical protein [Dehalococcoidia bacterium]